LFGTGTQWHKKKLLEVLDRFLQDLRGNSKLFGNTLMLLAGDFRQTLPFVSLYFRLSFNSETSHNNFGCINVKKEKLFKTCFVFSKVQIKC